MGRRSHALALSVWVSGKRADERRIPARDGTECDSDRSVEIGEAACAYAGRVTIYASADDAGSGVSSD